MNNNIKRIIFVGVLICLFPLAALADNSGSTAPTLTGMFKVLKDNLNTVTRFVTAAAYVFGAMMMVAAVHELRIFGVMRGMMPITASAAAPVGKLFISIGLMCVPSITLSFVQTLWGSDTNSIQAYFTGSTDIWQPVMDTVALIIRLFGFMAVVQGFSMMAKSAKQGAAPGMIGKGIMHLVGGILGVNIVGTVNVVLATFGFVSGS